MSSAVPSTSEATKDAISQPILGFAISQGHSLPQDKGIMTPPEMSASPTPISPPPTIPAAETPAHPLPNSTAVPTAAPASSTAAADTTPSKPNLSRRASQLHSSRAAPPSPASSRRTSQIHPNALHSPSLSARERASSNASSAGHVSVAPSSSGGSVGGLARKSSVGQNQGLGGRGSGSKARPRSSLGTAMYTGGGDDGGAMVPGQHEGEGDKMKARQSLSAPTPQVGALRSGSLTSSITAEESGSTLADSSKSLSSKPSLAFSTTNSHNDTETSAPTRSPNSISPTSRTPLPLAPVVIRDYAFPSSDERYFGRGQPIPEAASSSSSRLSQFLTTSAASPSDRRASSSEGKREKEKGWGFSMLSWRGFIGRNSRSNSRSEVEQNDTSGHHGRLGASGRSADTESDIDIMPADGEEGQEDDYAFESSSEDDEEPFGLYRAAYAFEAEGEHEISLEEGEVVEVKGRGGGEGWVIAVKLRKKDTEGENEGRNGMIEGLVPEGYLEKVNEEELRSGMIRAGFQGGQSTPVAPGGISEEPEESSDLETGAGR